MGNVQPQSQRKLNVGALTDMWSVEGGECGALRVGSPPRGRYGDAQGVSSRSSGSTSSSVSSSSSSSCSGGLASEYIGGSGSVVGSGPVASPGRSGGPASFVVAFAPIRQERHRNQQQYISIASGQARACVFMCGGNALWSSARNRGQSPSQRTRRRSQWGREGVERVTRRRASSST